MRKRETIKLSAESEAIRVGHPFIRLTVRQFDVLKKMADAQPTDEYDNNDGRIIQDGGECWLGLERISYRTVKALLIYMLVSVEDTGLKCQYYAINESGTRYVQGEHKVYNVNNKRGELEMTDRPLVVPWF